MPENKEQLDQLARQMIAQRGLPNSNENMTRMRQMLMNDPQMYEMALQSSQTSQPAQQRQVRTVDEMNAQIDAMLDSEGGNNNGDVQGVSEQSGQNGNTTEQPNETDAEAQAQSLVQEAQRVLQNAGNSTSDAQKLMQRMLSMPANNVRSSTIDQMADRMMERSE